MQENVRIERLQNDMVLFENEKGNLVQMRPELVKSVHLFPPEHPGLVPWHNDNCWRVQVAGEGYVVFTVKTHEEALDLHRRINEVLEPCRIVVV